MKFIPFASLLCLLLGFSACNTYTEQDKDNFDQKIQKFVAKGTDKYEKSESGLYYAIEKEGEGDYIKYTDMVSFKYEGKFLSGEPFDNRHRNTPLTFQVSQLIEGWKEAFLYLKKGGKAKIIVPPYLGYGDHKLEDIPANSILFFTIEVVDVN